MTKNIRTRKPRHWVAPVDDGQSAMAAAAGVSRCTVLYGALRLVSCGGKVFGRVRSRASMQRRPRHG